MVFAAFPEDDEVIVDRCIFDDLSNYFCGRCVHYLELCPNRFVLEYEYTVSADLLNNLVTLYFNSDDEVSYYQLISEKLEDMYNKKLKEFGG
jgi:hypothetical protein